MANTQSKLIVSDYELVSKNVKIISYTPNAEEKLENIIVTQEKFQTNI